jgi:hypothetical protein
MDTRTRHYGQNGGPKTRHRYLRCTWAGVPTMRQYPAHTRLPTLPALILWLRLRIMTVTIPLQQKVRKMRPLRIWNWCIRVRLGMRACRVCVFLGLCWGRRSRLGMSVRSQAAGMWRPSKYIYIYICMHIYIYIYIYIDIDICIYVSVLWVCSCGCM